MPHREWKLLLQPGTFWVSRRGNLGDDTSDDGGDLGDAVPVEFTADDVRRFHEGGQRMLALGFPIPVPLEHDERAGPVPEADRRAKLVANNTGWVSAFRLEESNGEPKLWACLDVDGIPGIADAEVPRVLRERIRYVSPDLWPELTLGNGETVPYAIKHVALTCQPIDFQQKRFGQRATLSQRGGVAGSRAWAWRQRLAPVRMSVADRAWWDPIAMAWIHDPGPRLQNRWRNTESGRIAYSREKPGSTRERIAAAEGDVDTEALRKALDPHERRPLNDQQKGRARSAWALLRSHHGDKALHRLREMALADVEAIGRGETHNARGVRLHDRLEAYRHMLEQAAQDTARRAPAREPRPWDAASGDQPERAKVYNAPTEAIEADPKRFQFKLNVDASGVTDELKGVKTFNPDFAGVISVWKDPANGKTYVVNGHHRHELARRTGHPELAVRYIQAKDAKEARAVGALVNIAEGRGTAIDAAKFMRDTGTSPEDFDKHGVSLKGKLAQDAVTLTRLSDRQFDRLAGGMLDQAKALAVAKHLPDHDRQNALFKLLDKREEAGKDLSPKVIEEMAREMAETPTIVKTDPDSLFKDIAGEESLFVERNELKAHTRGELSREVRDFLAVASKRRAAKVGKAGNVLDPEANRKIAQEAERVLGVYDTLVNRKGEISDALNTAAADYAKAKTKRDRDAIRQRAVEAVRDAVFREAGVGSPDRGAEKPPVSGGPEPRAGQPEGAAGQAVAEPDNNDAGTGGNAPAGVEIPAPAPPAPGESPASSRPEPAPPKKQFTIDPNAARSDQTYSLFDQDPSLVEILAPVAESETGESLLAVHNQNLRQAMGRFDPEQREALGRVGLDVTDGADLERLGRMVRRYQQGQARKAEARQRVPELQSVPVGGNGRVGGFFVTRQRDNQYRIEAEKGKGHVTGTADEIAAYITEQQAAQNAHGRRLPEALARAEAWTEPTFLDAGKQEEAARAYAALPEGTPVVSLDRDAGTHGRTGRIVKDDLGKNRVRLDGEDGFASNHIEPLDRKLSWRISDEERQAAEAARPRQAGMFDAPTPEAKKPVEKADKPAPPTANEAEVASTVERLAKTHSNFVPLEKLRGQLEELGLARPDQDDVLKRLRRQRVLTFSPHDGREGLPAAKKSAALVDGGEQLHYVSVRHADTPPATETPKAKEPVPQPTGKPPGPAPSFDPKPGNPHYEQHRNAILDGYEMALRFKDGETGMAPTPLVYQQARQRDPSLTPERFRATLAAMEEEASKGDKDDRVELHTLNEVRTRTPEQRALGIDRGNHHLGYMMLHSLARGKRSASDFKRPVKMSSARGPVVGRTLPASRRGPLARLSLGSPGGRTMADEADDLFTDDELSGGVDTTDADLGDMDTTDTTDTGAETQVPEIAEAAELLAQHGVMVDPSGSPKEFLRHLCTALRTHKATKDLGNGGGGDLDNETDDMAAANAAARPEPEYVSMSMFRRANNQLTALRKELAGERLAKQNRMIDQLERAGVGPERVRRWRQTLAAKQLSLAGGEPEGDVARVLAEMDAAKELLGDRVRMSLAREETEPDWARWEAKSEQDRQSQEEMGDRLAAMAGVRKK